MLTRIALPVKVLFGLAMATQVQPRLLIARAMGEGYVVVGDLVEEVNLLLLEHGGRSNGVDGRIAPSLIEEATILVQGREVVNVRLGPQPFQAADFKVGPLRKEC